MPTRTRVPTKVIWATEDIVAICRDARQDWQAMMDRTERLADPVLMRAAASLRDHLAEIEVRARDARQGEYRER